MHQALNMIETSVMRPLLHALEQVSGVIRALQSTMVILLTKTVRNVNLQTLTILAKWLILVA